MAGSRNLTICLLLDYLKYELTGFCDTFLNMLILELTSLCLPKEENLPVNN